MPAARDITIRPGYAPMRRAQKQMSCATCPAKSACQETVSIGWMLCEAPDDEQLAALERQGIDLLQLTTELWEKNPEMLGLE